jgi:hypothetical protein
LHDGTRHRIQPGDYELSLPCGEYRIELGTVAARIRLLSASRLTLNLDASRFLTGTLESRKLDGSHIEVRASLHGRGTHEVQLAGHNVKIEDSQRTVNLRNGSAATSWKLQVQDIQQPWVVQLRADHFIGIPPSEVGPDAGSTRPA